jgi:hypothetical protein
MPQPPPRPVSGAELRARQRRVLRIARRLGFVGRVEYRHVSTESGGAKYGMGPTADEDLLVVYPRAFERDADPEDFSLEAIIAHERAHQIIVRHPRLARPVLKTMSFATEEILASVVSSLLVGDAKDQRDLMMKAVEEATRKGQDVNDASAHLNGLRVILEKLL